MSWIPLHVHSQYSILDSSASIEALVSKAKELGMPSIALTDSGNLYGVVEFFKACKKAKIKPIVGCELHIAPGSRLEKKKSPGVPPGCPLVLLAKNQIGYQNLCKLSSIAHLEGFYYTPRIDKEVLEQHKEGLICLCGSLKSKIARLCLQDNEEQLKNEISWYHNLFGEDFYFELQRHFMSPEALKDEGIESETWLHQSYLDYENNQRQLVKKLHALSQELDIPCVATNGSHYIERDDWRAHEILINIQSGEPCEIWERDSQGNPKMRVLNPKRQVYPTHELYFKSSDEMQEIFSDFPEALENSMKIAEKCNVEIDFKSRFYTVFVPPELEDKEVSKEERIRAAEQYLTDLCDKGISERYDAAKLSCVAEKYPGRDPIEVVNERLKYELNIIISMGMCDYLLIVRDFIVWAKNNGIAVGPGRGSGAGSIVLYLIGITDIEPLRFNLFFERFINPERISYPDIDVDICMQGRSAVIEYTVEKYGQDKVAQIITFGTMKAKMAIKDVGRVLSIPLPKVNAIAKLVPEDPTMTLDRALDIDPELRQQYENDEEVHRLLDLAKKLEGSVRNTGIHAAGLIVCGDPVTDHIPICRAKDTTIAVTQFSMKPVEQVGMLKIDFLGLTTLTSIEKAVKAIADSGKAQLDWVNLPLDDANTFALLNQGKTLGIFQLESGGMQELAKQLEIDKFEEIIAVGALYRPGPMEMIPSFINRKHGREPIEIDHPEMGDILAETYGIMVYQEQVMQISNKLANYTLGEGDMLRRAMGKKDRIEMEKQRDKFRLGAMGNGIDEQTAITIFDKIEKFASYGFNKSHATAYGYLTYVTAYLKANYPHEWMASLMTCARDDLTKVAKIIRECQAMNIAILPPDVNEAGVEFAATNDGIRFAMTAIKGVGEAVVESITADRKENGPYQSLYDFARRIDTRKVGKKVIEYLIEAGSFDFTKWSRCALLEALDPIYREATREQEEESKGVLDLFACTGEEATKRFDAPPDVKHPRIKQQILMKEKQLLGFYLTGHPMEDYVGILPKLSCVPFDQFSQLSDGAVVRAAFILDTLQIKISAKTQRKFAITIISDGIERFELPVWPELYEANSSLLKENQLIYAVLQIENSEGTLKLQTKWLGDLTLADDQMISECDTAFERAKERSAKRPKFERSRTQVRKKEKMVSNIDRRLSIDIDMERTHLSDILKIKNAFRTSAGSMPVNLTFFCSKKRIGTISVESTWGVEYNASLKNALKEIDVIKQITVTE